MPSEEHFMFTLIEPKAQTKSSLYDELATQLRAPLAGEKNFNVNAANSFLLLIHAPPDLNWAGSYVLKGR